MIFFTVLPLPAQSGNRRLFTCAAMAFVVGVGVTAWGMTQLRPAPSVVAVSAESHDGEEPHNESSDIVRVSPEAIKSLGITAAPVSYQNRRAQLTVPGVIEARADSVAKVTPPVAGRLLRLFVAPGSAVRTGEPLAVLDSYEIAQAHAAVHSAETGVAQAVAALQTVRAEASQSRTRLQNARTAERTRRELSATGVFTQSPLQDAQIAVADAETALAVAETERETDAAQLARTEQLFAKGFVSRNTQEQARLEVRQDDAEVRQAQVRLAGAQTVLKREQAIAKSGLRDRDALQAVTAERRDAESTVVLTKREEIAAEAALAGTRETLSGAKTTLKALEGFGHIEGESSQITLYAPFDGVVSARFVTPGETVERSSPLLQIENLSSVIVTANVSERDISQARVGASVSVSVAAFPGQSFGGRVESLATGVDEKTRTLAVRCRVPNPGGQLRPEMFATVRLATGQPRRVLSVPSSAVVLDGETPVVFVAGKSPGEYERRLVTRGEDRGGVEITAGLKPGERVVVAGAFTLLAESRKSELSNEHGH